MPNHPQPQPDAAPGKLRRPPSWSQRYAQSRALGLLASLAVCCVGFGIFASPGLLWGSAERAGNVTSVVACYALIAGFTIFWVWPGLPVSAKNACPTPSAVRQGRPMLRRGSALIALLIVIAVIVVVVALGLGMSLDLLYRLIGDLN